MKIHHIRNATFVIQSDDNYILVDPTLGKKGVMPAFSFIRNKAIKNPTVSLPKNAISILEKVTHCIITHQHPDHIDSAGKRFLRNNQIPVICSIKDAKRFQKDGLLVIKSLKYWESSTFLGGSIMGIPAVHGYGLVTKIMGNVIGFLVKFSNQESIYISADTVYTKDVKYVLDNYQSNLTVLAAGKAQFDFGKPLLMNEEDLLRFINSSPNKVYANHLDALNHCTISRKDLRELVFNHDLQNKVLIPEDGETINL